MMRFCIQNTTAQFERVTVADLTSIVVQFLDFAGKRSISKNAICHTLDVIRNKVFGSLPQCTLSMTHAQIMQAGGRCHEPI